MVDSGQLAGGSKERFELCHDFISDEIVKFDESWMDWSAGDWSHLIQDYLNGHINIECRWRLVRGEGETHDYRAIFEYAGPAHIGRRALKRPPVPKVSKRVNLNSRPVVVSNYLESVTMLVWLRELVEDEHWMDISDEIAMRSRVRIERLSALNDRLNVGGESFESLQPVPESVLSAFGFTNGKANFLRVVNAESFGDREEDVVTGRPKPINDNPELVEDAIGNWLNCAKPERNDRVLPFRLLFSDDLVRARIHKSSEFIVENFNVLPHKGQFCPSEFFVVGNH